MSETTPTPLQELEVKCSDCDFMTTADRIQSGKERFFHDGLMIGLPNRALSPKEVAMFNKMALLCECCKEERDDHNSP